MVRTLKTIQWKLCINSGRLLLSIFHPVCIHLLSLDHRLFVPERHSCAEDGSTKVPIQTRHNNNNNNNNNNDDDDDNNNNNNNNNINNNNNNNNSDVLLGTCIQYIVRCL